MIRSVVTAVCLLVLTGCSNMKIEDFGGTSPEFRPEEFFLGRTTAWGFFQDRFGTVRRQFTVEIDGRMEDGVLILDEDFVYDDGETDNRVWRLTIGPDGTYTGTAADVVGEATGRAVGRAFQFKYIMDLPVGDSTWRVSVDDWMFQQSDDVMLNRSTFSKWGFELGQVFISFTRHPAAAAEPDQVLIEREAVLEPA